MEQVAFRAMGCQMLALLDATTPGVAARLARVPCWFAVWERHLSRFRADSELNRLNRRAGQPVRVSRTLWQVVRVALDAARASDGLVTPTLLAALEAAGYDRSFAELDQAGGVPRPPAPPLGDWRAIECDGDTRTVRCPAGLRLDLGGVAKGWASDRAAAWLARHGPALVDAGGDIAVSAPPVGEPGWAIGVADPTRPGRQLALLCVPRGGVATSGRDYRRWWRDGRWWHHLLDPRTGLPAETDLLSATVIAPTTQRAELAAKVALFLGSRAGLAWLERRGLAGLLVREDGQVVPSERLPVYLWR